MRGFHGIVVPRKQVQQKSEPEIEEEVFSADLKVDPIPTSVVWGVSVVLVCAVLIWSIVDLRNRMKLVEIQLMYMMMMAAPSR